MCTIIGDADAELIRQKKQLDQVEKQTKRGRKTVRLGEKEILKKKELRRVVVVEGRGGEGIVKGVLPCFTELTGCTDCYKDERDQSLGLLQAH